MSSITNINNLGIIGFNEKSRRCFMCKENKILSDFGNSKAAPLGKLHYCRLCALEKNRKHRKNSDFKIKQRNRLRKNKYGLSEASFKVMFDVQGSRCGICEIPMDFYAKSTCIDHDHVTGNIREILCQKCNLGLGHFSDDIENMEKAIAYLRKHSEEHGEKIELKLIEKSKENQ